MGQSKLSWDEYFVGMAAYTATKSKDPKAQVGCVVVGPDHEVRSMGYNDHPRGLVDFPARRTAPLKFIYTEHAERNAIYNAARIGAALKGCSMYSPRYPCAECARAIVQAGIVELITSEPDFEHHRWGEDARHAQIILYEGGVKERYYNA